MPESGVLVLHGFTGQPMSVAGLAAAFSAAGFDVELPTLPGHGTRMEDMVPTRWADWLGEAQAAYDRLSARVSGVLVAALSMGGALACRIAVDNPGVAGLVLVNPLAEPPGEALFDILRQALEQGIEVSPGIGSDIARPGITEAAYDGAPIAPALSMYEGVRELAPRLPEITCPVLLFTSPHDHVVPPSNSDYLAAAVSGPVERVTCERSYHVATLDWDREMIEERAVAFARRILAPAADASDASPAA
ncbi:MAG TPA: alpha/beta fold hydrolase [Acidimicrobiales bacterium]|nr:alpha/beta fold hydrolase [Acidimicrobiales bacterium]